MQTAETGAPPFTLTGRQPANQRAAKVSYNGVSDTARNGGSVKPQLGDGPQTLSPRLTLTLCSNHETTQPTLDKTPLSHVQEGLVPEHQSRLVQILSWSLRFAHYSQIIGSTSVYGMAVL